MQAQEQDLTNIIFFPLPTIDELENQQQKVEDLREEAQIRYDLSQDPDDLKRIITLAERHDTIYAQLVALTAKEIRGTISYLK